MVPLASCSSPHPTRGIEVRGPITAVGRATARGLTRISASDDRGPWASYKEVSESRFDDLNARGARKIARLGPGIVANITLEARILEPLASGKCTPARLHVSDPDNRLHTHHRSRSRRRTRNESRSFCIQIDGPNLSRLTVENVAIAIDIVQEFLGRTQPHFIQREAANDIDGPMR